MSAVSGAGVRALAKQGRARLSSRSTTIGLSVSILALELSKLSTCLRRAGAGRLARVGSGALAGATFFLQTPAFSSSQKIENGLSA